MLPIEAITRRIRVLLVLEFPEYEGRIYLNRTLPLNYEAGEVPGIVVTQGSDVPNNDSSTLDRAAWIASLTVAFTVGGVSSEEPELVVQLNTLRQRAHRAMMADENVGFEWVLELAPGQAQEIASDAASSTIVKELSTNWQALYLADRRNPDVSYSEGV